MFPQPPECHLTTGGTQAGFTAHTQCNFLQCCSPTEASDCRVPQAGSYSLTPYPPSMPLPPHPNSHLLLPDASPSTFAAFPGRVTLAGAVPTSPTRGDASPSLLTPDRAVYSFPAHPRSQKHTKETEKRVYSYKTAPERQTRELLSPFQQTGAPRPPLTSPTHGRSPPSATAPGQHLRDLTAE